MPVGLILQRWKELDAEKGPLGCPISPEADVPGRNGRKSVFEHGEIAWSPDQGANMVVAAYQQEDNLVVNWSHSDPFTYEKFIVRWDRNGQNIGQADVEMFIEPTNGFFRIPTPPPGVYSIIVEGCDEDIGGSHCPQSWTIPVFAKYDVPPIPLFAQCNAAFQPFGLIGDRWARMGGAEGPLGCPTVREHPVPGRNGAAQSFQHGEISWSPDQGEMLTVVAYQKDGELVVDWGDTWPFKYEKFILRMDKDGANIAQHDLGEGSAGHWSTPVGTPGNYMFVIEGCDEDLGGSDCPQKWTVPVTVPVSFPPPPPAPPFDATCPIEPIGLIRERWLGLGGKAGPMGCPLTAEQIVPGRNGRLQPYANGEIVWSPDQGDAMTLAVFQQGREVVATWGSTSQFEYDTFLVRLDYEGANIGQTEVVAQGQRSGGYRFDITRKEDDTETPIVGNGTGRYSVIVEGCTEPDFVFDGIHCRQRWTIPASVNYHPTASGPDYSSVATPRTLEMALQDKAKRALIAVRHVANGPLDGEWGENQTTHATAMLYVVADKLANDADKSIPRRFAQRFNMIGEINNAIRGQGIHAKSGTSACNRTGEYDVALKGYIPLLYRYGNMLAPDVRYRILHLLNKTGPHDPDDDWISCVLPVAETENHIWMIESSRYLTNQLYAKRTANSHFNNAQNGMDDYILKRLGNHMINDFIEYNARPYGRYTWAAIQNLADYAENQKVKDAAKGVLDYLSAKAALSGNDGRRSPPYRRRVSNNKSNYFHEQGDRIKKRFMLYTAPTLVMKELTPPNWLEDFAASEVVLAAASNYQPPTAVIDLMVNTSHRSYYQDFSPPGEIYAAEPDFLIAGGGIVGTYAYTVAGIGKDEDLGVAQPTVLVPTGQFTTPEQMIRFRRPQNQDDFTGRCVAPGFACGYEPTIPPLYTRIPQCTARRGAWTFIDFSSDACKDAEHREFGFFAAVFRGSDGFGLLEVVPKARLNGSTLTAFADLVIASNGTPQLSTTQPNSYVTFGGNVIRFNPGVITPILSTGVAAIDDLMVRNDAGIARGTVVQSIGNTGKMTITNAFTGEKIGVGIDVPPAPPASMEAKAMHAALKKAGVDHSVPEPVVLDWLDNRKFTPYPAISDALLNLIEPGYLKRFVYLDVIVWNYVHTPGAASPRKMSDVDVAVLKQAILGGYNSRYGTAKNSFDSIFTPGAMSDPGANSEAGKVLAALAKIGVDISVPKRDMLEWLANREFTPYPAISEALFRVIGNKRLKQPVYLDVIVWNYEHTPGVVSPRKTSEVDLNLLRKSVLQGYNTRYGVVRTRFEGLLVSRR